MGGHWGPTPQESWGVWKLSKMKHGIMADTCHRQFSPGWKGFLCLRKALRGRHLAEKICSSHYLQGPCVAVSSSCLCLYLFPCP